MSRISAEIVSRLHLSVLTQTADYPVGKMVLFFLIFQGRGKNQRYNVFDTFLFDKIHFL